MILEQPSDQASLSPEAVAMSRLSNKIVKGQGLIHRLERRKDELEVLYTSIGSEVDCSRSTVDSEMHLLAADVHNSFNGVMVSLNYIFQEQIQVFNQVIECAKQVRRALCES